MCPRQLSMWFPKALIAGILITTFPVAPVSGAFFSEPGALRNAQPIKLPAKKHKRAKTILRDRAGVYGLSPKETYHQVWQIVQDNYYDPGFNGQEWAIWEHKFDSEIHSNADAFQYVKLMLDSLKDPYTRIVSEQDCQPRDQNLIRTKKNAVGIGAMVRQCGSKFIIAGTLENSPASTAGIEKNDEIVSIDGSPCLGCSLEQLAKMLQGDIGSKINLSLRRDYKTELKFRIIRTKLEYDAVKYEIRQANIGYIKIQTFMPMTTSSEFRHALEALSKTDGLIIDLRDNPGGLLASTLEIADMLLDDAVIVEVLSKMVWNLKDLMVTRATTNRLSCWLTKQVQAQANFWLQL